MEMTGCVESMESHEAGFPLFPHPLEIPSGLPHSHGLDDWIYVFSCPLRHIIEWATSAAFTSGMSFNSQRREMKSVKQLSTGLHAMHSMLACTSALISRKVALTSEG